MHRHLTAPSLIAGAVVALALASPPAAHGQTSGSPWAIGIRGQYVSFEASQFLHLGDGYGVVGFVQRKLGDYVAIESGVSLDRQERRILCISDLHSTGGSAGASPPCADGFGAQGHVYLRPTLRIPGLPVEPYGGFQVGLLHGEITRSYEDEFPALDVGLAGGVLVPIMGRLAVEVAVASTWIHGSFNLGPDEGWGRRVAIQLGLAVR